MCCTLLPLLWKVKKRQFFAYISNAIKGRVKALKYKKFKREKHKAKGGRVKTIFIATVR